VYIITLDFAVVSAAAAAAAAVAAAAAAAFAAAAAAAVVSAAQLPIRLSSRVLHADTLHDFAVVFFAAVVVAVVAAAAAAAAAAAQLPAVSTPKSLVMYNTITQVLFLVINKLPLDTQTHQKFTTNSTREWWWYRVADLFVLCSNTACETCFLFVHNIRLCIIYVCVCRHNISLCISFVCA